MAEFTPDLHPNARIKIFGVGGGGGNAVTGMVTHGVAGVEFIAVNTDAQALSHSPADHKIHIGRATTRGLGAGSDESLGSQAAEENLSDIEKALEGADMVFITAGMGGGTGTGAAPIIAAKAKEMGILTVGVTTKPFGFEGGRRMTRAIEGIKQMRERVDTLIVIPNDRILNLIDKKTPLADAFMYVDEVLRQAIQGVSDLITQNGFINVDFADVRAVMKDAGSALVGIGVGTGENRAIEAARHAIDSPLLERSITGAKGALINITGGDDLSMAEFSEAAAVIQEAVDPEANMKIGTVIDPKITGEIKITVIATGFPEEDEDRPAAPTQTRLQKAIPGAGAPRPLGSPVNRPAGSAPAGDLDVPAFLRKKIS